MEIRKITLITLMNKEKMKINQIICRMVMIIIMVMVLVMLVGMEMEKMVMEMEIAIMNKMMQYNNLITN